MDVRPSPIAGQWYPADAAELAAGVDRALDAARTVFQNLGPLDRASLVVFSQGARVAARPVPMPYNDGVERVTFPTQHGIAAAVRGLL